MSSRFDNAVEHILSLLTEKKRRVKSRSVSKRSTASRSQANRKKRAREVKISNYRTKTIGGGERTRHTCEATSAEQSESKIHECRIDTINKTNEISDMVCSCSDFQSRFRYYRNEDGVSRWNTVKPIKSIFEPHTREAPEVMNPDAKGYTCKHLLGFLKVLKRKPRNGRKNP